MQYCDQLTSTNQSLGLTVKFISQQRVWNFEFGIANCEFQFGFKSGESLTLARICIGRYSILNFRSADYGQSAVRADRLHAQTAKSPLPKELFSIPISDLNFAIRNSQSEISSLFRWLCREGHTRSHPEHGS